MPLTVGTAGHIDHGKTWLVRALTGKDTDRLPEEQRRGISIELGYAPLELPGGVQLSLIDVPGHERFVRTMVAGATGIDLFLLVVDAREGPRAQTHEHLAILRLLGVEHGIVAVTKADAADPGPALAAARELVPGAEALAVSARTGQGLEELRAELARAASHIRARTRDGPARLFVDRVFTLRGIGTVATGTLWSGSVGAGDELRAEPSGLDVRVRSGEVHDRPVDRADAGQRVAVALTGVDRNLLGRGVALVEPGAYAVGHRLEVALEELEPIAHGARVRAHHGTTETAAKVVRRNGRVELRLSDPARSGTGAPAGARAADADAKARAGRHRRRRARARRRGRTPLPGRRPARRGRARAGRRARPHRRRLLDRARRLRARPRAGGRRVRAPGHDHPRPRTRPPRPVAAQRAAPARTARRRRPHPPRRRRTPAQAPALLTR